MLVLKSVGTAITTMEALSIYSEKSVDALIGYLQDDIKLSNSDSVSIGDSHELILLTFVGSVSQITT